MAKRSPVTGFIIYDGRNKEAVPGQCFESREDAEAHIQRLLEAGAHPLAEFSVVQVPLSERWRSVK